MPMPYSEDVLIPPGNGFHVLSRTSLIADLKENFDKKLILVTAGAGWGKTTLLTSYVMAMRHPYVWYTLSESDRGPDRFLSRLSERIRQIESKREFRTRYSLEDVRSGKASWKAFGDSMMHMISQMYPQKICLVLDDFHHLESSKSMNRFFEDFIERSPLNLQVIISSRRQPGVQFSKSKLYGYAHQVETKHLAFSYEECRALIKQIYGLSLPDSDIYGLIQYTSGWPVAIRLLGASLSGSGDKCFWHKKNSTSDDQKIDVDEYFEKQVMDPMPLDVRRSLMEASIFQSIDPEVCHKVLKWPDSENILDRLYKDGFFLSQYNNLSGTKSKSYRYHSLFRDFLSERLKKEITSAQHNELHVRAGRYFTGEKRWGEALTHFIEAKEYRQATDIVLKALDENLKNGSAHTIIHWIKLIPDQVTLDYPQIIYAQATAYFLTGEWEEALRSIELCVSRTKKCGPPALHAAAMRQLIILYFSLDKYAESIALAEELKTAVPRESPIWAYAEAMNALALLQITGYQKAADAWANLAGHPALEDDKGLGMESDTQKAVGFYFLCGKVDTALGILDKAVTYLRGSDFMGRLGRSLFFLAFIQYEIGHLHEGRQSISEAIKEFTGTGNFHRLCASQSLEILILMELGRIDEASERMRCLDQMVSDGSIANDWKSYFFHIAKARLSSCHDHPIEFAKLADKAIQAGRSLTYWNDITVIFSELALGYAEMGNTGYAVELLEEALAAANQFAARLRCATINLLLAYLYHSQNDRTRCDLHLETALSLSQQNNYDSLFLSKYRKIARILLPHAAKCRLHLDYAAHLIIHLNGNRALPLIDIMGKTTKAEKQMITQVLVDHRCRDAEAYLAALIKSKDDELRLQAENALSIISRQPPIALRIRMLGDFSLRQGDREIAPGEWKRKTAKAIFAYMAYNAQKDIKIDNLIDLFFAKLPLKTARTHIHQAVSTIRKVLEPGIMPKRESAYIKGSNGMYHFVLPMGSEIDALRFEELCKEAKTSLNSGDRSVALSKYTEALSIFRGEFLMEESDNGWNTEIRMRLRNLYAKALLEVSEMHFKLFSYEECIEHLTRLLSADPFEERAYYMLMRCHYALGDRPRVIQIFKQCEAALQKELGIEPGDDILELYRQIRDK